MSEKLLKILLSELATARVICKKCGRGIIEVPVDRLDTALMNGTCRFCNHPFLQRKAGGTLEDPLRDLRLAIEELRRMTDLEIEFVLPDKG
jgi:hypothetical protein